MSLLTSKYSDEQIQMMPLTEFFSLAEFDDIFYSKRMLRVGYYARESTTHDEQLRALDAQKERLSNNILNNPMFTIENKHRFVDEGISGRTTVKRVALQSAIEAASRHEYDVLIVQDVYRLGRNLRELLNNIDIFKNYKVGILILTGRYWTYNLSETDIVRLAVDGGMAQGESMRTSKRVNNGIETYRERGQLIVSELFGYDYVRNFDPRKNTFRINPVDGLTVRKIFELYTHPDLRQRMGSAKIARYLNVNGYKGPSGKLDWSASKVNRVLKNEKYMGYILYGKWKVVDNVTGRKIATHIEPVRDSYDENGNLIKGNLVKGNWEPLIDEETWWLAHEIRTSSSGKYINSKKGALRAGLRSSSDIIAQKSYCACGYTRSPQYVHTAKYDENGVLVTPPQFRYTCRCQINADSCGHRGFVNGKPFSPCKIPAASETKLWLMSLKVFEYMFGESSAEIIATLKLVSEARKSISITPEGKTMEQLQKELEKVEVQIENLYLKNLAGEIDDNMRKQLMVRLEENKISIENSIASCNAIESRNAKSEYDFKAIEERLNSYVDFTGKKVSDELIDLFVERIIYRDNDEYLWEMNLSGIRSNPNQYRIGEYDKDYADMLCDDKNFNIIHKFIISVEECEKYMKSDLINRRFIPKYWKPITVKIAIK